MVIRHSDCGFHNWGSTIYIPFLEIDERPMATSTSSGEWDALIPLTRSTTNYKLNRWQVHDLQWQLVMSTPSTPCTFNLQAHR